MEVAIHEPNAKSQKEVIIVLLSMNQPKAGKHGINGHIGYSGLQYMLDKNLVEGFSVDKHSPKPDCVTCTKAKKSVEPFDQPPNKETEPKDLIHIDLWGKYYVASIHGNCYYLLIVDDSTRYITTEFIKEKSDAAQKVKYYLAQLISHDRKPKAICIDQGKEFLNNYLTDWCHDHGIEVQMTVPYSPSQNGVAERMNRTLVEIAQAMM